MSARPLRVTHVILFLEGGGMESLVGAMATRYAGSDIRMSVITLDGRLGRIGEAIRGSVESIQTVKPTPLVSMVMPLGLVRAIRRTRPDVVHLHSGGWYKGALAARLAGAPRVVYTEHGLLESDHPVGPLLLRMAAMMTDAVVTVNDELRSHLREAVGVSEERLFTVRNGVDVDRYTPAPAPSALRSALGIPEGARIIGSMGRMEPVKAYDNLIDAFARLPLSATPPHLVLCGDGSLRGMLMEKARDVGVANRVHFPGWVDSLDYYRLFDIFTLSSLSEGVPMSLLEAMATGAAPVVTDVGGNRAVLGESLSHQLARAGDVASLAERLDQTLALGDPRGALGGVARQRVSQEYSLAQTMEAYERIYRGRTALDDRPVSR